MLSFSITHSCTHVLCLSARGTHYHLLPCACPPGLHKYPHHPIFASICIELLFHCHHFSGCCHNTLTLPISAKPIPFCSRAVASPRLDPKRHGRKGRAGHINILSSRGTWGNLRPQELAMSGRRAGLQARFDTPRDAGLSTRHSLTSMRRGSAWDLCWRQHH